MNQIRVPGAFWVALILGLIPIIQMYFNDYRITAGIVLFLELVAKLIQVYLLPESEPPLKRGLSPAPASAPKPKPDKLRIFFLG